MNMLDMGMPQLQGEKKGLELRDLFHIIWRRKWLILIPLMIAIGVGGVLCRVLPKKYSSSSVIFFKRPEYPIENVPRGDFGVNPQAAFKDRAKMLVTSVMRQEELEKVFEGQGLINKSRPQSFIGRLKNFLFGIDPGRDPSITEQYEDALSNLTIEPLEDRPAIVYAYTATDPVTARNVCDKIGELLFDAESGSGQGLLEQRDEYKVKCDTAKSALLIKSAEIRKKRKESNTQGTVPEELEGMRVHSEVLKQNIRDLDGKMEKDRGTLNMQQIRLAIVPPVLETPPSNDDTTTPTGKDDQDMLYRDRVKQIDEYLKNNPNAPDAAKLRATRDQYKIMAAREDTKIKLILTELPRLLARQEELRKQRADNTIAYQEKFAALQDRIETLAEDDKVKMGDNPASAMSPDERKAMEDEKEQLMKETKALSDAMGAATQELLTIAPDIKEYRRLMSLTDTKLPEAVSASPTGGSLEILMGSDPAFKEVIQKYYPDGVPDNVNPDALDIIQEIATLVAVNKRDTEDLGVLKGEKKEQDDKIEFAIALQAELDALKAEEDDRRDAYNKALQLLEKATAVAVQWEHSHRAGETADIRKFDAELPLMHSSPKFMIVVLLSIIGGLIVGGAITLFIEMTDHTVKRPTDLRRVVNRPILAAIPALDIGRFHTPDNLFFRTKHAVEADLQSGILFDKNYVKDIRFRSIATEQIRKLRLSMVTPDGDRVRTILVTSALAGEGKSTVAANLAIAISQMIGEHVLLIDADLRRPDLQNFFGMAPKPGLSEYLEHDLDLRQLLVKTEFDKLTLLQAGKVPANSTELLSSDRMRHLVREVKSRYPDRYIIIDSPPVLSTSEPNVLANQVDGVILVVRAGMTPRELIEDVIESLNPDKIMGVVMNDVRAETSKYYSPSYV